MNHAGSPSVANYRLNSRLFRLRQRFTPPVDAFFFPGDTQESLDVTEIVDDDYELAKWVRIWVSTPKDGVSHTRLAILISPNGKAIEDMIIDDWKTVPEYETRILDTSVVGAIMVRRRSQGQRPGSIEISTVEQTAYLYTGANMPDIFSLVCFSSHQECKILGGCEIRYCRRVAEGRM